MMSASYPYRAGVAAPAKRQRHASRIARRLLPFVVASWSTVGLAAQIRPGDLANASLEELMNVQVTTATRVAESLMDAPARMQVITDEQIQRRGYRSLLDVLEDLPDFKIDRGGDPDYPSQLTVQGTRGANHLIVLLDGVRVSSPTNEPLPFLSNYPVHVARQIEILYGPASAVYGADAFTGVINIISKTGISASGLTTSTAIGQQGLYDQTVSFGTRVGSEGSLLVAGQVVYDRQPDLTKYYPEDFKGLQGQRAGVFETIYGPMTPPRAVSPDYEAPISTYALQTNFQAGGLRLALFANRARTSTSLPYTPDNGVYDAEAFGDNRMIVASGSYTRTMSRVESTSTLTFSRHELHPDSGYWNVFSNMERSYKYAYGSMLKLDEQLVWKPAPSLTLTTGGTAERFFAIPQGADLNTPVTSRDEPGTILDTDIPDEFIKLRYANIGAYAQAHYAPTRRLAVTLGARADHNTRYGSTFNPRVGVVLKPARATTLKLMYGTAFLAPSPYEAYSHYGSFYTTDGGATYASNYWHVPNPNLRPQQKRTVEAHVLRAFGDAVVASGSVFYSRFTDLRHPTDPDQAYAGSYLGWPVEYIDFAVNEGRATTYGGTLALDVARSLGSDARFAVRAAVSLVDGDGRRDDEGMADRIETGGMSPVQARIGGDLDWGRWSLAPRLGVTGRQRTLATGVGDEGGSRRTLPGYTTLDVNVRRRNVFKQVDLFVTVRNALDARYRQINTRAFSNPEELIGVPQNPRRVIVGFDLRIR